MLGRRLRPTFVFSSFKSNAFVRLSIQLIIDTRLQNEIKVITVTIFDFQTNFWLLNVQHESV